MCLVNLSFSSLEHFVMSSLNLFINTPVWNNIFPFLPDTQTRSGVQTSSYSMGTLGFWPPIKRLGREPQHLPPRSVTVKHEWSHTYTPTNDIQAYLFLCLQTAFLSTYKAKLPALLYTGALTPQKWSRGRERKVKEKCK